jgi:hypothetical protein
MTPRSNGADLETTLEDFDFNLIPQKQQGGIRHMKVPASLKSDSL